jgi:hypothetical protein
MRDESVESIIQLNQTFNLIHPSSLIPHPLVEVL